MMQPSPGMPWICVTVYQPPKGTLIVNATGFWSEGKARTCQRSIRKEDVPEGGQLLAVRVRPVLAFTKAGVLIEHEDFPLLDDPLGGSALEQDAKSWLEGSGALHE